MNQYTLLFILSLFCCSYFSFAQHEPTFEDILSLQAISNAQISPDGNYVVYQHQSTDWENNRYDRELWISDLMNDPFQLTNTKDGSSSSPQWSHDSGFEKIGRAMDRCGRK
jgi:dipeptidyl aminopeptidase/acylaminoacyl peptidase